MASSKERQRWERWYDQMMSRMKRQADSIQRLVLLLTEATAALEEIAAEEGGPRDIRAARKRAREALDRVREPAAAVTNSEGESEQEDLIDPRRKH